MKPVIVLLVLAAILQVFAIGKAIHKLSSNDKAPTESVGSFNHDPLL